MEKKIIKIDMDGVIRDILTPMTNLYNTLFGTKMTADDVTDYNVDVSFPLIRERTKMSAASYFFDCFSEYTFLRGAILTEGAKDAMDTLHDSGLYYIMIVTHQPCDDAKKQVVDFLSKHKIPYDSIVFTKDKHLIRGDVMIDDNPEFINADTETPVRICIDYPYNRVCDCTHRMKNLKNSIEMLLRETLVP